MSGTNAKGTLIDSQNEWKQNLLGLLLIEPFEIVFFLKKKINDSIKHAVCLRHMCAPA